MIDLRNAARALGLALTLLAAAGTAATADPLEVVYRAADVVYLDAGSADGLRVGTRLSGDGVELLVTHLARETAAARVIAEAVQVLAGHLVEPPIAQPASLGPAPFERWTAPTADVRAAAPPRLDGWRASAAALRGVTMEGAISFDWEVFRTAAGRGSNFERRVTRISLQARGLGSEAHAFRLRMSGQRTGSADRDRLYEAALVRRFDDGPVGYAVGRIADGARMGYGAVDGVLGELALRPDLSMGGFYGSPAELDSWDIAASGQRYGLFAHYASIAGTRRPIDLQIAGIREVVDGQSSRDYLAFEGRVAGLDGRWSIQQRFEIDVHEGWRRELTGRPGQLSALSLHLTRRFAGGPRLSVSYDRYRLYRSAETRWLADEIFDDRPRHALRTRLTLGPARGWRVSLGTAVRARVGDPERSYSFTAGARSAAIGRWGIAVGADLLVFDNPLSDGYTAHLRLGRSFEAGRRLYVDLGRREWQSVLESASRWAHWVRLGGDHQLSRSLALHGEIEISTGDALAGRRSLLGLRYRLGGRR